MIDITLEELAGALGITTDEEKSHLEKKIAKALEVKENQKKLDEMYQRALAVVEKDKAVIEERDAGSILDDTPIGGHIYAVYYVTNALALTEYEKSFKRIVKKLEKVLGKVEELKADDYWGQTYTAFFMDKSIRLFGCFYPEHENEDDDNYIELSSWVNSKYFFDRY